MFKCTGVAIDEGNLKTCELVGGLVKGLVDRYDLLDAG